MEALTSSSDKLSEDGKREMDEAARGLYEIFKDRPRRAQEQFNPYYLVVEDAEIRWRMSEVELMIRQVIASAGKRRHC